MFISREVFVKIIRAHVCSSRDTTRSEINGVRIKRVMDRYYVNAVDGHCMVNLEAGLQDERFCDFLKEDEELSLDVQAIPRIELLLKCYPKHKTFVCEMHDDYLKIDVTGDVISLKKNSRPYPKIETIQSIPSEKHIPIMFKPTLLSRIHAAMKFSNCEHGIVLYIDPEHDTKPIIVKAPMERKDSNIYGIIMPMKQ